MSYIYSIACTQCKVKLWIAQGWGYEEITKLHLYSTEEYLNSLKEFLQKHYRHPLIFDEGCESPLIEDYVDISDGEDKP